MARSRNIRKENYKAFADAVCMGLSEQEIAKQFNVAEGTVVNYQNYAKGYAVGTAADKKLAELTYYKLGKGVLKQIARNIDAGNYYGLKYKKNQSHTVQYGPRTNSNPIKEEGPAVVQQKLPLQSAMESAVETSSCSEQRGPVSINAVDLYNLIKRMVDMRIEDALTLRAAIDKLKVV